MKETLSSHPFNVSRRLPVVPGQAREQCFNLIDHIQFFVIGNKVGHNSMTTSILAIKVQF